MKEIQKLIIPDKIEALLYLVVGFVLLLALNIKKFWLYLGGTDVEQLKYSELVNPTVQNFIFKLDNDIIPRVADFIVWMAIGVILFLVVTFVLAAINSTKEQISLAEYINKPKNNRETVNRLVRLAIRVFGVVSALIWLNVFFIKLLPDLTKLFFTSILSLNDPASWLWLLVTTLASAAGLYLFAIIFRFIALKARVFS